MFCDCGFFFFWTFTVHFYVKRYLESYVLHPQHLSYTVAFADISPSQHNWVSFEYGTPPQTEKKKKKKKSYDIQNPGIQTRSARIKIQCSNHWAKESTPCRMMLCGILTLPGKRGTSQLAFYVNLHRAVIGPSATLTGRWLPDIYLRRMLTGVEAAAIVMYMYLYSLAFMDHPCTLGAAVCHKAPPYPLYTQPRTSRVWDRRTNGLKIVTTRAGFEPTTSRLKVECANH